MRRRLGWLLLVAVVLVASCTNSNAGEGAVGDETDVWFLQHMAGHLLQTSAVLELAGDEIAHPELGRLAAAINREGQADLHQLQAWLAARGLAPYDPQQDPNRRTESDLLRLSRVHGAGFDRAFVKVMTARHRAGLRMAETEVREGGVPEVRALARQMATRMQSQLRQMTAWNRALAKKHARVRAR